MQTTTSPTCPTSPTLPPLIQCRELCPHCKKAYYRRDNNCNLCGEYSPPPPAAQSTTFDRSTHAAQGKTWDSKKHKYVINKK